MAHPFPTHVGMRPRFPTATQVRELPVLARRTIPPEWEDSNGHVNIQYYMTLYEWGGWPMIEAVGMDEAYFRERRCGLFDLEHHLCYLNEIHVGDVVTVHARLLDRTAKRFHGLMFIVNETRDNLAGSMEYVTSGADLENRRTAPLPADIGERLDALIAEHGGLSWPAPVCGVMSA